MNYQIELELLSKVREDFPLINFVLGDEFCAFSNYKGESFEVCFPIPNEKNQYYWCSGLLHEIGHCICGNNSEKQAWRWACVHAIKYNVLLNFYSIFLCRQTYHTDKLWDRRDKQQREKYSKFYNRKEK